MTDKLDEIVERLKRKRASSKGTITRIENFVSSNKDKCNVDVNVTRETLLIQAYEKYSTIQEELETFDENEESDRIQVEQKFLTILSEVKRILSKFQRQELSFSESKVDNLKIKLPNINIPIFDGKVTEWNSFKDLFKALVDDNIELCDVQKFSYLRSSLMHEPLSIIKDLQLTNDNYRVALDISHKRYDDQLTIINMHLSGLIDVQQVTKCDFRQLREFITNIKQNFNSLQALKLPVDQWDIILVYVLIRKLDNHTRTAYELERESSSLPTFDGFMGFLEKRCRALENVISQDSPRDLRSKQRVANVVTSETKVESYKKGCNQTCSYCSGSNHTLYSCRRFKFDTLENRREFVRKQKLCYNCLGFKHRVANCQSSGCRICNRKHHSLLCPTGMGKSEGVDKPSHFDSAAGEFSSHHVGVDRFRGCPQVLLGTTIVKVAVGGGRPHR
ncbi:uncharacterized protein LOC123307929 [Coccinella septempunctata]|uniref:uncharacterized protein LOC123307929 n=1 Tax=Coccinella septempunctata TaxID=41139 RepID=UPI001D07E0BF|nr:uncharacterized protein LOC123307929 [Coccinella septempunctata]